MKAAPRPYHHGHLREALLRAAEKALETGGVQSISLRELSRELGVSHGSPRRHFVGKRALLDAMAIRGFEQFGNVLGRAIGKPEEDFKSRLTKFARAYIAFAVKHPALLNLMFEAKVRPDAPRELAEAAEKTFSHGLKAFIEAQAAGEVVPGDPARLALVVSAALLGLLAISTNRKFHGVSLDRLTAEIIERMILGFQPRT